MHYRINDILEQKINEIQKRLPVKIKKTKNTQSFKEILNSAIENTNVSNKINNNNVNNTYANNSNINRTINTLDKIEPSVQYIPQENANSLMSVINRSIIKSAEKYEIDPNLIRAVIKQESNFNPYAISKAGAQGIMQLMPETALLLGVNDPWNVEANIDGGTRFLKTQLQTFNGDIRLALAAYNAGPNAVKKYNGIPPYSETQNYVEKVLEYYKKYTK